MVLSKFVNSIGDRTILFIISFYDAFFFTLRAILHLLLPKSYNKHMHMNLIKQIYHTTITTIPYFFLVAFFFGSLSIGLLILLAAEYNMQYQIGSIIVTFVINEFSILFSVFFIIFRSQHLLKKNISILNTTILDNLILASILSGIFNTYVLAILFSIITISSGYIFTFIFMGMDFYTYKHLIYNSIDLRDIIILLIKSIVYGFTIMVIPLYKIEKNKTNQKGILMVFLSIFFLELLFIFIQKVIHAI